MTETTGDNVKRIPIGIIGMIIGAIALFVAIFSNDIEAKLDPPVEKSTTQLLLDAGKTFLKTSVLKEEVTEENILSKVDYAYMTLGFIAMVIGVISWVKKDHVRISGAAVSLGLVAVAWQYVLVAVVFAVVLLIIFSFS